MKRRTAYMVGLAAAALLLLVPGLALATTNEPIAETGGMSATLPLMGTTLTVDIALDSVGNITTVDVNPLSGMTKTTTDPGYVRFATSDGKTSVSVLARGGRLSLTERTTLANLQGGGTDTWSADVFATGHKSTVAYTIGKDSSGNPIITLGTISPASGITATADAKKVKSGKEKGGWAAAVAGVEFAWNGWTKHLSISVTAKPDGTAKLSITLSGRDKQKVTGTLAQLAGARTWSAHLCDGTAVKVTYHVASDGSVVFDSATGAPATSKTKDGWLWVTFTGTKVGMLARLKSDGSGTYTLVVRGFSGACGDSGHGGCAGDKGSGDPAQGNKGGGQGWVPGGHRPH
ncbi:MAG: hypothetical protein ACHQZR_05375 [Candidatus Limnocylindrales bacterium]